MHAATGIRADDPGRAWGGGRQAALRRLVFAAMLLLATTAQLAGQRLAGHLDRARLATGILAAAGLAAFLAATLLPDAEEEPLRAAAVTVVPEPVAAPLPPRRSEPEPPPGMVLPPAPEPWQPVRRPIAVYHLESAELDRLALRYQVETRGRADRRDTLIWTPREAGTAPDRPMIVIAAERYEAGAPTMRPFFPDLAARAAAQGLAIERLSRAGEITTKFGAMEIADAILEAGGTRFACLAFRRNDAAGLTLAGWYCGSARRPADRLGFGCFIDRLDLVAAGRDRELKRLFAAAERSRRGCGQGRVGARKASWLDHETPAPVLKLTTRAK